MGVEQRGSAASLESLKGKTNAKFFEQDATKEVKVGHVENGPASARPSNGTFLRENLLTDLFQRLAAYFRSVPDRGTG
jgi:hypothetical protein